MFREETEVASEMISGLLRISGYDHKNGREETLITLSGRHITFPGHIDSLMNGEYAEYTLKTRKISESGAQRTSPDNETNACNREWTQTETTLAIPIKNISYKSQIKNRQK